MIEENKLILEYDLQFFAEGPGGEKTEEPTAKKLGDARNEGQVAKSTELSQSLSLIAMFGMLSFMYTYVGSHFVNTFNYVYGEIPDAIQMYDGNIPFNAISQLIKMGMLQIILCCAPFFLAGVVVALVSNRLQFKFKITTKPLQPKFSKMNPASGIKRIFSKRSLFELLKSVAKIIVIGAVVFSYLNSREESIFLLYDMPLTQAIGMLGDIIAKMGLRVAIVYLIIGIIDFVYQKRKFHEDMKMTKQEVKDEFKNSEGDPQIKSKQRQRMQEASRRRMMKELPKADVVITNPTHYAVAIIYEADKYDAPRVIAKGADFVAQKIKEVAKENKIEIVENKPLARMLYANVEIGEFIPPELYKAVAEVLAYVYHLKGKV